MKSLLSYTTNFGANDVGSFKAELAVDGPDLVANMTVSGRVPLQQIIEPATKAVDNLLTKLEKAIPGDWDKPLIEKFKDDYKKDLIAYLNK